MTQKKGNDDDELLYERVFKLFKNKDLSSEEFNLQVQADRVVYIFSRSLAKLNVLAHLPYFLEDDGSVLRKSLKSQETQFIFNLLLSWGFYIDDSYRQGKNRELISEYLKLGTVNKSSSKKAGHAPIVLEDFPDVSVYQFIDLLFYNRCIRKAIKTTANPPLDKNVVTLMSWLSRLKDIIKHRIYVTGEDHRKNEQELRTTYKINLALIEEIDELKQSLQKQRDDFKKQLEEKRGIIEMYKNKKETVVDTFQMDIKKAVRDSENRMMQTCLLSESHQAQFAEEAEEIVQKYDNILKFNLEEENKARAKRLKIESQLLGWINTYDQDSLDKQGTWEKLMDDMADVKGKLKNTNDMLAKQDVIYANAMREKAEEEERIFNEMAYQLHLHRCAMKIQTYWRLYVTKRMSMKKKKHDAVPIVIAMGTPGDKTGNIEEVVVKTEPEPILRPRTPLYTAQQSFSLQQTSSVQQQPSTSEMGVIERIPVQFPLNQTISRTGAKPDSFQESQLEQSKIEHYYVQTKYYPDYQQPTTSKSFLSSSDQPGPSGLQTPTKSKPAAYAASPGRLKKSRKEQQGAHQSRKSYQCPYCKKCFASSDKLEKHAQTHTGSSPFKCDNCKKIFTSKFKLVRHSLIHSDRKPFSCTVCDRTFHRKDHLKNHVKVHSPQKDVYICDNCKKQYTSLLSYRKHLALHAAEAGNLTCQICQLTFDSKEKILFHLKIHAGSRTVKSPNEKKFKCEECGRRFFTRKDVRRHNVVHTGMRDFLCQYCPQRFGRKDHLVRHIKKSHNNKYKADESASVPIKIEPTELPETIIKTEYTGTGLISELGLPLIEGDLTPFLETENLLASSSTEELKYLSDSMLVIESTPTPPGMLIAENVDASQGVLDENEVLLSNSELLLLEAPEEKNLPLPGFSQTFQSPPGPQQ